MSPAPVVALHFWHQVSRLGEAQILLPAMLLALLWLMRRPGAGRLAIGWLAATLLATVLTTATKVAFIGYGVGYAPLDFTGVSGHAMFAAAILPPLGRLADGGLPPRWRGAGLVAGIALAALIAVARVAVGAHSPSEAMLGFVLGAMASGVALAIGQPPKLQMARWLPLLLCVWVVVGSSEVPALPTHDWVTRLALATSGRPTPYRRWQLHRDYRRQADLRSLQPF